MVAGKLDPLREDGYRIFHGFPGGPNWNIDHIAIGPGGLFVIETKVRSKRRAAISLGHRLQSLQPSPAKRRVVGKIHQGLDGRVA